MIEASAKMGIALRSRGGLIPDPPEWLVDINKVDSLVQRGYRMEEIEEMDIQYQAGLSGIMEAEAAKMREDMRKKPPRR